MSTCYKYLDMNGRPAVNVQLAVKDNGVTYSAISNSNGVVRFEQTFSADAVPYPVGFGSVLRMSCDTPPPYYPPSGEVIEGEISSACQVIKRDSFGMTVFKYRSKYDGYQSQYYTDYSEMKAVGLRDPRCSYVPPPPPPPPPSNDGKIAALEAAIAALNSKVAGIYDSLSSMSSQITNILSRIANLEQALSTMFYDIINGLVSRILSLESRISGFETRINALSGITREAVIDWITDAFIVIVEKALDREVKR